jgi:hypothetical protein
MVSVQTCAEFSLSVGKSMQKSIKQLWSCNQHPMLAREERIATPRSSLPTAGWFGHEQIRPAKKYPFNPVLF